MQFSTFTVFFLTVLAAQTLASRGGKAARVAGGAAAGGATGGAAGAPTGAATGASKEGQPCTGRVDERDRQGTCDANGRCGINTPPNIFDSVASDDCE
ncbi:hypothetical protein CGLO_08574 [Colletotrichum gloeosporioides Cg-14]|uniref:Uncharacterized protein n=1 Tax=Colletotrichum gloeosporioides (strain Cg-14) TaxID=1237896 RepID=T0LUA0_COLGC|nr:hypothetical protein CGLO_08574 [Colletotrichum gloeosporioides Cg-14]